MNSQNEVIVPDALAPAWLLLSFGEERQYAGNLGYDEEITGRVNGNGTLLLRV